MIKYKIKKNIDGISDFIYILNRDGNEVTIEDDYMLRQTIKNLSKLIEDDKYEIFINNNNVKIKLIAFDTVYIFENWFNIYNMNIFKYIREPINKRIMEGKFIDKSNLERVKRKPRRYSKFNKATVIKVVLFGIIGTAVLNIMGSFQTKENEPDSEITNSSLSNKNDQEENERIVDKESFTSIPTIEFDFDDLSSSVKARNTKANYYDLLEKYAKEYGLDPELVLGIATQERGTHSTEIDIGGGIGLMQIQYNVWLNKWLRYYKLNDETGNYDYFSSEITDERMKNLETNIEIGCRILQWCLINSDYNLPIAIQMYNMGYGTMNKVIEQYGNATGKTREQIINNPMDLGWMKYCKNFPGDPNYLENVNSWIFDNTFVITNVFDKSQIALRFTNENERTMKI